ncbi:MAG: ribose 5-phosphate isomerase A [Proteobacteria bacterium]|nr:ribose 5-phosphate isomerase A [Pseudomonadota bacterium]
MSAPESASKEAAEKAVRMIQPDMVVGLGSGKLVELVVDCMATARKRGELPGVTVIPGNLPMAERARALGLALASIDDHEAVDLVIDTADEVDPEKNGIKRAGAFLQEKVLSQAGRKIIWVVDEDSLSPRLGSKGPVPVEVVSFAQHAAERFLTSLGARVEVRTNVLSKAFRTEHHNLILDADFGPMEDPGAVAIKLSGIAGIVEHGLFLNLASQVIVAGKKGVRTLNP